ncbi:MAG: hypothetical protein ACTSW1_00495, partial [Candidatus Hodarchaeales archaeon]
MGQCACGSIGTNAFSLISQKFCDECFVERFEKSFLKRIPRVVRGSSIAVAFSGEKDSTVLLHILSKYKEKLRLKKIYAITLRQEIAEFQQEQDFILSCSQKKYTNIKFIQKSYIELFGYDLDYLVRRSDEKGLKFTPCSICGILKTNGVMRIALELKVDYIAYGNTLEDEVEAIFLNIMRNQPERNFRDLVKYKTSDGTLIPRRLKPLATISESDIKTYTSILALKISKTPCPYRKRSLRSELNPFIRRLRATNPHVLYNTIASIRQEKEKFVSNSEVMVQKCGKCEFYCSSSLCP